MMQGKKNTKLKKSCQICCETFTSKLRNSIKCNNCNNSVCLQCFKKFLLTDGSEQVCMCCKVDLNTEFIFMHTPKVFQRMLMTKISNLEFIREKAMLKSTQEEMELQYKRDFLKSRERFMKQMKKHLKKFEGDREVETFMNNTSKELGEVTIEINKKEQNSAVYCPITDCEGLIKKDECSHCKNKICKKCQTKKEGSNHECNKDILETLKLIHKDTKSCPRCSIPIFRIDGCDQMFCVKCKTPFSWRSGEIITGVIHNPHYFEWMRGRGVLGNIDPHGNADPCEELFETAVDELFKLDPNCVVQGRPWTYEEQEIIENHFVQRVTREISVLLPAIIVSVHDVQIIENEKKNLRLKYILGKQKLQAMKAMKDILDEEGYQKSLNRLETTWFQKVRHMIKKREMKKDIIKLLETFDCTLKDSVIVANKTNNYSEMFETIISLVAYFQTQLRENEKRYDLKNFTNICIYNGIDCRLVRW